ncbi:unnamed protein product [Leptidea sinapis]|nr:unnamed protein product [Leptidea sinapis]
MGGMYTGLPYHGSFGPPPPPRGPFASPPHPHTHYIANTQRAVGWIYTACPNRADGEPPRQTRLVAPSSPVG